MALGAVVLTATASAKAPLFTMFDYSAKAGISVAKFTNIDPRMSFYVGGAAEYYLDAYFSVQPELIISGQGGRSMLEVAGAKSVTASRLTYLDIPVLLKVVPLPGKGLSVEAGPMMGFCLGAQSKNKTTIDGATTIVKESISANVNTVQFGISFGASYVIDKNIGAQVRYNYGFTNIVKSSPEKIASQSLEIGAFYLF